MLMKSVKSRLEMFSSTVLPLPVLSRSSTDSQQIWVFVSVNDLKGPKAEDGMTKRKDFCWRFKSDDATQII